MNRISAKIFMPAVIALGSASLSFGQSASTGLTMSPTRLDFKGSRSTGTMYMPSGVPLSSTKPSIVKKEPQYEGTVEYGVVTVGNGPDADHAFAIDIPKSGDPKIYIDLRGNGDLTQTDGQWPSKVGQGAQTEYEGTFVFRASYGNAHKEISHAEYGLNFYWNPLRTSLFYYRAGTRQGEVLIGNQKYTIKLIENNNDGVYETGYGTPSAPTKPLWLVLDGTMFDCRGTFAFNGYNYEALLSMDGSRLTLKPTTHAIIAPVVAKEEPKLLPIGTEAPDFEVPAYGGGTIRLSSLRGRVVVLDFWATWCGPCKASLPHLQKVYDEVKNENVYVLALNVWDDKKAYDEWIPENSQYRFPFAYDPSGRSDSNIAKSKYNVSGIPTTYVIDPNGKISAEVVGFDGLDDHRLEQALSQLHVAVNLPAAAKTAPMIGLGGH